VAVIAGFSGHATYNSGSNGAAAAGYLRLGGVVADGVNA
jgi:hypothetical protein